MEKDHNFSNHSDPPSKFPVTVRILPEIRQFKAKMADFRGDLNSYQFYMFLYIHNKAIKLTSKQDANCVNNQFVSNAKPTEVCRDHPWGDPTQGTWPDGLDCSSQPPPAYICNQSVQDNVIKPNTKNLIAINADASPSALWQYSDR